MNIDLNDIIKKIRSNKLFQNLFYQEEISRKYVVIEIGSYNVKLVHFEYQEKIKIKEFNIYKINYKKNSDFEDALQSLLHDAVYGKNYDDCRVIVLISGQNITNRFIVIPKIPEEELAVAIKFEVKKLLHVDPENILINYEVLNSYTDENGKEKLKIFVAVIKNEEVNKLENIFKEAGLPISELTIDSILYSHSKESEFEKGKRIAFIDIGAENTNFNIIKDGILEFSRNIPMGGNAITELIAKDISGSSTNYREFIDESDVEKKMISLLEDEAAIEKLDERKKLVSMSLNDGLSRIIQRIRLTIGYFKTQVKGKNIDEIVLSGGTSNIQNIEKYFSDNLDIKTIKVNIPDLDKFDFKDDVLKKKFIENSSYSYLLSLVANAVFEEKKLINFFTNKEEDKIDIDYILDRIPEPDKIFGICAILVFSFYSINSYMNISKAQKQYKKYESVKEIINSYRDVEQEIKWNLNMESRDLKNVNNWVELFKNNDTRIKTLLMDIIEHLPENAFAQEIELKSIRQYDRFKYILNIELEFAGQDNYKQYKFYMENPGNWNIYDLETVIFKDKPPIRKEGTDYYTLRMEAQLY